jgi:predicted PurR-regulated permease PerM
LNAIGFMTLGVDHAVLFALLAAILNIIPYIGVIVGGLFPVMIVLVTQDNSWIALGVLGVTVVVQFLDNNFIYPKVVGSSVSINPLVSILALIVGNLIWGTAGMILALPLAGMLKVVMDNIKCVRPYGYLMGEEEKCEHKTINFNKESIGALRHLVQMKKEKLQEE